MVGLLCIPLLHVSGRTFPWCGEPTAWTKGRAQLSVPTFPPLLTHCTIELSAISLQPFLHKSLLFFFCRQSYFITARFISGQLVARRQDLRQFAQNPRFTTGSSLTRGAQDH